MEYLLKSAVLISIFYFFYRLFIANETFFRSKRWFFLSGIILSMLLPLYHINTYVILPENSVNTVVEKVKSGIVNLHQVSLEKHQTADWHAIILGVYIAGILVLSVKLLIELISLFRLISIARKRHKQSYICVETEQDIPPFSFFRYLVFNPREFTAEEQKQIIAHELVHIKQWHSVDMLLVRLFTIVQWYNPIVWLYRRAMVQNLEFIADKFAQDKIHNLKSYQYLLLKIGVEKRLFALTNNFINTNLKKRIMMLQKTRKSPVNQLKYILLLPAMMIFLYGFNTRKVYVNDTKKNNTKAIVIDKKTDEKTLLEYSKILAGQVKGASVIFNTLRNKDNIITRLEIVFQYSGKQAQYYEKKSENGIDKIEIYVKKPDIFIVRDLDEDSNAYVEFTRSNLSYFTQNDQADNNKNFITFKSVIFQDKEYGYAVINGKLMIINSEGTNIDKSLGNKIKKYLLHKKLISEVNGISELKIHIE